MKFAVFIFVIQLSSALYGQLLTPLSQDMNRRIELEMIKTNTPFFTVSKPYVDSYLTGNARQDSLNILPGTSQLFATKNFKNNLQQKNWLSRKLFDESLVQVDSGEFYLFADPVFEFGLGKEINGKSTYINTRGFRAGGRIGKHFAFGADFYENQGQFNSVVSQKIGKTWMAPGEGLARKYDSTGFDYAHSSGYVSVQLLKNLNIRLAQGRQFIGDGYRSLLLSDASYTYPYMKLTWQNKYFSYAWSKMSLQEYGFVYGVSVPPYRRKSASLHTLGVNIKNKVQLTLIKMQLFDNPDSVGSYTFKFPEWNPVMLPDHANQSTHSIWGTNIKIQPFSFLTLYNQLAFDNLFSNYTKHYAVQAGLRFYNTWRKHSVYFNVEYNRVPAMTYTSPNRILGWRHYTEPLAHPYGHNFEEGVLMGIWSYKRWQLSGQINVAHQLENITDVKPFNQQNLTYYPNGKKLNWYKTELTYFLNQKTLMNLTLGFNYRNETLPGAGSDMKYFYFSFNTRLFNKYYDF